MISQYRTITSIGLLLVVCTLAACGKTGALYLPDTSPAGSKAPPAAEAGKTP